MKNTSCMRMKQKTTVPVSKAACFDDLPEEIVAEILVRLTARTLVSSKSVCKLWLYLISNPMFVKTHLLNSCNNDMLIFTHKQYRPRNQSACYSTTSYFIKSIPINFDDGSNVVVLDYPTSDPLNIVIIVGSCHGLVCITIRKVGVFLWNPCTRISRELPLSGLEIASLSKYGFGYDQFSDDYKVVFVGYPNNDSKRKKEVKVYSLKSDSWEKIRDFPQNSDVVKRMGKHVNGIFHWMVKNIEYDWEEEGYDWDEEGHNFTFLIVSLNLGNETFGEIKQPIYEKGNCLDKELCVLDGCLSVFCRTKDCADIWVMKEYGNSDTWIKLYTIPNMNSFPGLLVPLCISTTGEVIDNKASELVLYNPNNGKFRRPICDSALFRTFLLDEATTYVESLVSPNIYEEESNTKL